MILAIEISQVIALAIRKGNINSTLIAEDIRHKTIMTVIHSSISEEYVNHQNAPAFRIFLANLFPIENLLP